MRSIIGLALFRKTQKKGTQSGNHPVFGKERKASENTYYEKERACAVCNAPARATFG